MPSAVPGQSSHWLSGAVDTNVFVQTNSLNEVVHGGSERGQFLRLAGASSAFTYAPSNPCLPDDSVLLELNDQRVAGATSYDVISLMTQLPQPISVKAIPPGLLNYDLRDYLDQQFYKGSVDHDLQNTIRDNIYLRTVPVTTRKPRHSEVDGVDYRFVSPQDFLRLEQSGQLLESGIFEGNYYGTPKPKLEPVDVHAKSNGSLNGHTNGSSQQEQLQPLPPNWEMATTEMGEAYFIDHNSGTTHWDDPRLPPPVNGDSSTSTQMLQDTSTSDLSATAAAADTVLPYGWERVDDPQYGTYYVDHLTRSTQYGRPTTRSQFSRNAADLNGEMITAHIMKGPRGLGFTMVGNDAASNGDEYLQIKSILPGGPAFHDGSLQTGDVIVVINGENMLGATQADAIRIFQSIPVGQLVDLRVCRGYPLLVSGEVQTHSAYASMPPPPPPAAGGDTLTRSSVKRGLTIGIRRGQQGFGFTISDSPHGQLIKNVLDTARCNGLQVGDLVRSINGRDLAGLTHSQVVSLLRDCPLDDVAVFRVERDVQGGGVQQFEEGPSRSVPMNNNYGRSGSAEYLVDPGRPTLKPRSKTPNPNMQPILPPKAPQLNGHRSSSNQQQPFSYNQLPTSPIYENHAKLQARMNGLGLGGQAPSRLDSSTSSPIGFATATPDYVPAAVWKRSTSALGAPAIRELTVNLIPTVTGFGFRFTGGVDMGERLLVNEIIPHGAAALDGRLCVGDTIFAIDGQDVRSATQQQCATLLQTANLRGRAKLVVGRHDNNLDSTLTRPMPNIVAASPMYKQMPAASPIPQSSSPLIQTRQGAAMSGAEHTYDVTVSRSDQEGFGFVIVSNIGAAGSSIGRIIPGSPAERCGRLHQHDRIVAVNGRSILDMHHADIVNLIKDSGQQVILAVASPNVPSAPPPVQQRPTAAQMNGGADMRHDGVSCDVCMASSFRGLRYKCLVCYDFDLCATCYDAQSDGADGMADAEHAYDHPMQCIMTQSDYEIYFGHSSSPTGESGVINNGSSSAPSNSLENTLSFTCPCCGNLGYTLSALQEHVAVEHGSTASMQDGGVLCPACAALPGGDANHMSEDLPAHLAIDHIAASSEAATTQRSAPSDIPTSGLPSGVSRRTIGAPSAQLARRGAYRGGPSRVRQSGRAQVSADSSANVDPIIDLLSALGLRSARTVAAASGAVQQQLQQVLQQATGSLASREARRTVFLATPNANAAAASNPYEVVPVPASGGSASTQPPSAAYSDPSGSLGPSLLPSELMNDSPLLSLLFEEQRAKEDRGMLVDRAHFVLETMLTLEQNPTLPADMVERTDGEGSSIPQTAVEEELPRTQPVVNSVPVSVASTPDAARLKSTRVSIVRAAAPPPAQSTEAATAAPCQQQQQRIQQQTATGAANNVANINVVIDGSSPAHGITATLDS